MDDDFDGPQGAKPPPRSNRRLVSGDRANLGLIPEKHIHMREADPDGPNAIRGPPLRIRRHVQRGRRPEPSARMNVGEAPKLDIWSAKFVAFPPGNGSKRGTSACTSPGAKSSIGGVTKSTIPSPIATTRGGREAIPHARQSPCRFNSSTTSL